MIGCRGKNDTPPENTTKVKLTTTIEPNIPDWHKNATVYEVNLRHFTPEGTFKAFQPHLGRLKEMGVDILWFMPVQPVGKEKRKGELGSPYSVADYMAINPEFGTLEEFRELVDDIHTHNMHLIIDWVPNHTSWDHPWLQEHPDWYSKDEDGNITSPINLATGEPWGWTDVADLNFDNREMRQAMIDALSYWVREFKVDGFRMDVAHAVPIDFWEECATTLYKLGPVFLMAEAETPQLRNSGAFVADYGWEMLSLMNNIAHSRGANSGRGKKLWQGNLVIAGEATEKKQYTALDIDSLLAKKEADYHHGYPMYFTSNHDENAWAGTEFERMGDGHLAFAVLTATLDGIPMLYTGQESGVDKQYEFFAKDEVPWGDFRYASFYKALFELKHRNEALWNGEYGGPLVKIPSGADEYIYAFVREKNQNRVVVVVNLSAEPRRATLMGDHFSGPYTEIFSRDFTELEDGSTIELSPWDYRVFASL